MLVKAVRNHGRLSRWNFNQGEAQQACQPDWNALGHCDQEIVAAWVESGTDSDTVVATGLSKGAEGKEL